MKNLFYPFLLFALIFIACEPSKPAKECKQYVEAANPDTTDYSTEWARVKNINVSFASIDQRYEKNRIPQVDPSLSWKGRGWKGERISSQLVIWDSKDIKEVAFEFSDFTLNNDTKMKSSIANAHFVRYVLTDEFGGGCAPRDGLGIFLVADVLDTASCSDIEANTVRPVWLTFDLPSDAVQGLYTGKLNITSSNNKTQTLDIELEVLPQTLPEPKEWAFHLDLWQHPTAVARINNVKVWSEEHWKLLEPPMKMLAGAGQKVITTTINKDPWNHQCYDGYADMITWKKLKDGSWQYNYEVFDRWVSFMMDLGIDNMINCYSMAAWNDEFHYFDETKKDMVTVSLSPDTKEFKALMTPFLKDFRSHLKEKGWLNITNIAMDERSPKVMQAVLGLIKDVAPEFSISLADNHKSYKEYPYLKDICIMYGSTFDAEDLAFRKANNLISTFYVCCGQKFPNVFTFSDPSEAVYIGWYAMGAGLDGFLRWAYNSWPENPSFDSRFSNFPGGDTFIIYPGGISSIRFERLKEGIQDYEKIRILKDKFTAEGNDEKLEILNKELDKFKPIGVSGITTAELVKNAQNVLAELSK